MKWEPDWQHKAIRSGEYMIRYRPFHSNHRLYFRDKSLGLFESEKDAKKAARKHEKEATHANLD